MKNNQHLHLAIKDCGWYQNEKGWFCRYSKNDSPANYIDVLEDVICQTWEREQIVGIEKQSGREK